MQKLLFGISGLPRGTGQKFNYATGIAYLKQFGLDAMELPFVRSVNVTANNKDAILRSKQENDFYLSAHASYYINLNADSPDKQNESLARIRKGAEALALVEGRSLIFHPGFYLGQPKDLAYRTIRDNLLKLPRTGIDYRLETTGKGTQFGDLEELVSLCREIDTCKLCIDFSHLHARGNGALRTYEDFAEVLQYIADTLGQTALEDLHMHISGIEYGPKGEKQHLPLRESDFNYKACLKALRDFDVHGCVICEDSMLEHDALLLKNTYRSL
ncbi:MAG: TIM barrel protein [Solidesulfovibrio sp.]